MKVEKFKVLLYLKKSSLDKSGKAPIMGRITVNNSMSQFSLKLSCTPSLWNPRESRLDGKSREAIYYERQRFLYFTSITMHMNGKEPKADKSVPYNY